RVGTPEEGSGPGGASHDGAGDGGTGGSGGSGGNGGSCGNGASGPGDGGDDDMRRALIALNAQVVSLMQQLANKQPSSGQVRPIAKLPEPAPFKGDPEDLERFRSQLSNT